MVRKVKISKLYHFTNESYQESTEIKNKQNAINFEPDLLPAYKMHTFMTKTSLEIA